MLKKLLSLALTLVLTLSLVAGNISKKANATMLNKEQKITTVENDNEFIVQSEIAPYSNIQDGGGGSGGNLTYYSYGIVRFDHPINCYGHPIPHHTIYLPSSFINKVNTTIGNWSTAAVIAGVGALLGISITDPMVIAIGTTLALKWTTITWKDNGNGVTLLFDNTSSIPQKIASGCNYYLH